jgi:hypothetical protein
MSACGLRATRCDTFGGCYLSTGLLSSGSLVRFQPGAPYPPRVSDSPLEREPVPLLPYQCFLAVLDYTLAEH